MSSPDRPHHIPGPTTATGAARAIDAKGQPSGRAPQIESLWSEVGRPSGRHFPPIDVLASLSPRARPAPARLRWTGLVWIALPFLGVMIWWLTQNEQLPPGLKAAPAEAEKEATGPLAVAASTKALPPAEAAPKTPDTIRTEPPPTAEATPSPAAGPHPAEHEQALLLRIESWRQAWATRDIDAYLSHYSPHFKPQKERDRQTWAANRRRVILSRPPITLNVSELQLERLDAQGWGAHFLQDYASGTYVEKQQPKTLVWVLEEGQWLIAAERALP